MSKMKSSIFMCMSAAALILPVKMVYASDSAAPVKGKKVVIAYEKTDFKKNLVQQLELLLKADSIAVTTIEHSEKTSLNLDPETCDAVFISISGVNSQIRPWIVTWLENNKSHAAKILLHVTQTQNWKVSTHVDAVTSASSKKDVKKLASEYALIIKNRISTSAPQSTGTGKPSAESDTQKAD